MARAVLLTGIMVTRVKAAPLSYQLNENIEASTTGAWDKATVIEVGAAGGEHEGECEVHFIGYAASYDRWLMSVYFGKVTGGAPGTGAAVAPAGAAVPFGKDGPAPAAERETRGCNARL